MKIISTSSCLLLMALLSCGEGTTGPARGLGDQTMSATVDAASWQPEEAAATYAQKMLNISGRRGTGESEELLELSLTGVEKPGSFLFGGRCGNAAHVRRNGIDYYIPLTAIECSGAITITRLDSERVAGTFSFIASRNADYTSTALVKVNNGSFDLKLIRR